MKIKIINLKNLSGYFSKILILVVVVSIFGKFFYNTRNVTSSFKLDSASFLKIINREISLLNNRSVNTDKSANSLYSKKIIDDEIGIVKMAMNQNEYEIDVDFANEVTSSDVTENTIENISEPAVRTQYRSFSIKCTR